MPLQDTFQSIAFAVTRFTNFSANAILFGIVPICLLVLRPAFASLDKESWTDPRNRLAKRLEDLVQAAIVASATATLVGLLLQAALLAGSDGEITMDLFTSIASTPFGRAYLIRLPLLAGLAVLLLNRVRESSLAGTGDDERAPTAAWWGAWFGIGAILLATNSFSGHAAVGNPRWLSIGNDIVHQMTGGTWFTGIIILAALVPFAWRHKDKESRPQLMTPLVIRFSKVAVVAITIVAITGTINSLFDVEQLSDLVEAGYGMALSVKIVIFLGILALGGINHFYVRRRLEKNEVGGRVVITFRKAIAIELAVGIAIMGVTGILTGMEKTRESVAPAEAVSEPATF